MLQNSRRLTTSNTPAASVAQPLDHEHEADRLGLGTCLMIWAGMITATWGGIAFVASLF